MQNKNEATSLGYMIPVATFNDKGEMFWKLEWQEVESKFVMQGEASSNPGTTPNKGKGKGKEKDVSSADGADLLASKLSSLELNPSTPNKGKGKEKEKDDFPPKSKPNVAPTIPPSQPPVPPQGAPSQGSQVPHFSWDTPMFGTVPDVWHADDAEEFYRGYDMMTGLPSHMHDVQRYSYYDE